MGGGSEGRLELLGMDEKADPLRPPELEEFLAKPKARTGLQFLVRWALILSSIFTVTVLVCTGLFSHPTPGRLTACKSNLKNVATALEMYSSDNAGHYPRRLEDLLPGKYLRQLPTCPAAEKMTFTDYQVSAKPDNYSFSCVGDNHRASYHRSAPNYPSYSAFEGLVDKPPD